MEISALIPASRGITDRSPSQSEMDFPIQDAPLSNVSPEIIRIIIYSQAIITRPNRDYIHTDICRDLQFPIIVRNPCENVVVI